MVTMRYLKPVSFLVLWISLVLFWVSVDAYAEQISPDEAVVGEKVNIADFGRQLSGDNFIGCQWDEPRDIYEIRIWGIDRRTAESLRLEWWGSVWPNNGSGGWMRLDDPWNGKWVRTNAKPKLNKSGQFVFKFPPLGKEEWSQSLKPGQYTDKKQPIFRNTLKVRLVSEERDIPSQSRVMVFGNSHWRQATFDIETRFSSEGIISGRIELINGVMMSIESLPSPRSVQVDGAGWKTKGAADGSAGVRVKILYVGVDDLNSNNLTRVTVRLGLHPRALGFSFVPQDVLKEGTIRIPVFKTIVSNVFRSDEIMSSGDKWRGPVRVRILERPEMTREMAMQGIPRLSPLRWVPLGVPSARQEFFVGPNGDWKISALSLNTDKGRDTKRWIFKKDFGKERQWDEFATLLDTRQKPEFDGGDRREVRRYLEDGHLPLIHVEWKNGALHYHHALTTTILLGDYGDDILRRGDETVVLLSKLQIINTTSTEQMAGLNLKYSINTPISLQKDGVIIVQSVDSNGLTALRGIISMDRPAGGGVGNWQVKAGEGPESSAIICWQEKLSPGETRTVYFKTPFVELLDAEELKRLKEIRFEQETRAVLDYW